MIRQENGALIYQEQADEVLELLRRAEQDAGTAAPRREFGWAGFFGRWIRCQRPLPAAVGQLVSVSPKADIWSRIG
jgi:hypothetical protein